MANMEVEDGSMSRSKEPETPFSDEFDRIDAAAIADPESGVKTWLTVGTSFVSCRAHTVVNTPVEATNEIGIKRKEAGILKLAKLLSKLQKTAGD